MTLLIDVYSGTELTIPESSIETNFQWTGSEVEFLEFSDLTELSGIGSLSAFTVRAVDGHFYVNSIDYAAVPEPGTLLLLGSGLMGLGFARRRLKT